MNMHPIKRRPAFQPVMGAFGIDERATTEAFEQYVGGVDRAQRMLSLYRSSFPTSCESRAQVFNKRAAKEGFSSEEINAFWRVAN